MWWVDFMFDTREVIIYMVANILATPNVMVSNVD
jgi:hypothetical protein